MQHKSRPHVTRYKRPKYPSGKLPYVSEDDDRFDAKRIFDKYESELMVSTAIRRATRWFKSHKNIPIHRAPRHMKEKLSLLQDKMKSD